MSRNRPSGSSHPSHEERDDVMNPDAPFTLKAILPLAYPNGGMTLSGLRKGKSTRATWWWSAWPESSS